MSTHGDIYGDELTTHDQQAGHYPSTGPHPATVDLPQLLARITDGATAGAELADRHRRLGIELQHWQTNIVPDLRERADTAEAELAHLHEGEETTDGHDPAIEHTHGQWLYKFNRCTPAQRLEVIAGLRAQAATGYDCVLQGHRQRLEDDRHAWTELARARTALTEVLAVFGTTVRDDFSGDPIGYLATGPVDPDDMRRWKAALQPPETP